MVANPIPERLQRTLVFSSRSITDMDVTNQDGEALGSIEELMLNAEHGQIAYAVVKFGGGFLGKGEKLFAIPWQAFSLSLHDQKAILQVPRERLEEAEGFDKDAWPDMADETWAEQVHEYYGYEPNWRSAGGRIAQA